LHKKKQRKIRNSTWTLYGMESKCIMFEIVKNELKAAGVNQVDASGEFFLSDSMPKLFPGGVYGFFVELSEEEAKKFFNEASERNSASLDSFGKFKPIKDNFYPIYWGKDKSIGKRPYEHLKNSKGTGSIRLSTYRSLENKKIHSITIIVDDNDKLENHLQNQFPHLLLTKTEQYNAI